MTTYNSPHTPGQTVWLLRNNKVISDTVGLVDIQDVWDDERATHYLTINYGFRLYNDKKVFSGWEKVDWRQCFATKEELLASL